VQHVQDPEDGTVSLVAQRPIEAGQELTITYINQFQGIASQRVVDIRYDRLETEERDNNTHAPLEGQETGHRLFRPRSSR